MANKERTAGSGPGSIGLGQQPAHPADPAKEMSKGIRSASEMRARAMGKDIGKARPRTIDTAFDAEKPDDEDKKILERELRRYVKRGFGDGRGAKFRKNITPAQKVWAEAVMKKLGRTKPEWDENIAIVGFCGVKAPKPKQKGAGQRQQ